MLNNTCKRCGSPVEADSGGYYFCKICGHASNVLDYNKPDNRTAYTPIMPNEKSPQGWICPICGTVMSPHEKCCIKCTSNIETSNRI